MTSAAPLARWTFLLAGTVIAAAGCRSAPEWMSTGMNAPELEGQTVDGHPVRLSAERGKVVAVVFFADWCPNCRGLYPTLRELATRTTGHPFVIIGVAADNTAAEIRDVARRERMTWPVIHDADQHNADEWGVSGVPTTYLVDAAGVIREFDLRDSSLVSAVDELIARTEKSR
jgi:peroxiredoxin